MPIPDEVAAEVLSRCGRHCCICRRFRPMHLQVHHIIPESAGGTDARDNLIALCLTCHSDVHTKRPFTRRFTSDELKQHRDQVIRLVSEGKLVPPEEPVTSISEIVKAIAEIEHTELSSLAIEILVRAGEEDGDILFSRHLGGVSFKAGELSKEVSYGREAASYEAALQELKEARLVKSRGVQGCHEVTHIGYLTADELMAGAANQ